MPRYAYQAARADGEVLSGQLDADDIPAAARQLQQAGHTPLHIQPYQLPRSTTRFGEWFSRRALQARDIELFTLELSTLLKAGLSLGHALQILQGLAKKPAMLQLCQTLYQAIRRGDSFSVALQQGSPLFDRLYRNMVRVGEASGSLELALLSLVRFQSERRSLRDSLVSALIYPCILILLAVVAMVILLAFVVPQFSAMFSQAGQAMPLLTRLLVGTGELLQQYGGLFLGCSSIGVLFLRRHWQQGAGREQRDRGLLRLPFIGSLLIKLETARFTRTLATLLQHGMSVLPALEITQTVMHNQAVAVSIAHAATCVRQGEPLSQPLLASQQLPALAIQLIQVGEQSGQLTSMLVQIADIYEAEVQSGLKRLLSLLEPVIIIIIAVFVTVVILSIVSLMMASNQLLL